MKARLWLLLLIPLAVGGTFYMLPRGAEQPPAPANLLDRARQGTWEAPPASDPPATPQGYQESDFLYSDGLYYLFATGSQDPAWVDVYVGQTLEELVQSPPRFTHVAPLRYPTVVKDGATWNLWGVNPPKRWTEHWVSNQADPTNFVYSDSPFQGTSLSPVVDFAVRQQPGTGIWYGVGFETEDNAPLLITRATTPEGPWQKLNYVPNSHAGGVFGDSGPPAWAAGARPDPNLVFTPDGRAWVLFTGRPEVNPIPATVYRSGMVEVNVETGKAIGEALVLFDPQADPDLPYNLASDLNLIAAPGQPYRIVGYTHNASYPLAELVLPDSADLPDAE